MAWNDAWVIAGHMTLQNWYYISNLIHNYSIIDIFLKAIFLSCVRFNGLAGLLTGFATRGTKFV